MAKEFEFDFDDGSDDLSIVEIPVKIKGKRYVLREAGEDAACRYRNALARCSQMGPEGNVQSIDGPIADVEPLLVSLCMFEQLPDGTGHRTKSISVAVVRSWPARHVKELFEKLQDISDMGEDKESLQKQMIEIQKKLAKMSAEELAKNEPKSTEDTFS